MREYPDQPSQQIDNPRLDKIKNIILETVKEELPDCEVNDWFIASVHFANMIDKIMRQIWQKI